MTACKELNGMLARQLIRIRQHLSNCKECTLKIRTLNGCGSEKEKDTRLTPVSVPLKAQEPKEKLKGDDEK